MTSERTEPDASTRALSSRRSLLAGAAVTVTAASMLVARPAGAQSTFDGGDESGGADTIQIRRASATSWSTANPTLSLGEVGLEVDRVLARVGDGATAWNDLPAAWQSPVVLDVRTFGATGDGVTNDTTAVTAAITEAMATGHTLFFPSGTYLCPTMSITVNAPLRLRGDQTTIVRTASSNAFSCASSIDVSGLTLTGGGPCFHFGSTSTAVPLIRVVGCRFLATGAPLFANNLTGTVGRVEFADNDVVGNGDNTPGITFKATNWHSAYIARNRLEGIRRDGLRFGSNDNDDLRHTICVGNVIRGLRGPGTDASSTNAIRMHGGDVVVVNNIITDVDADAETTNPTDCEGIYTAGRRQIITGNVLIDAGRRQGQIAAKGHDALIAYNYIEFVERTTGNGIRVEGNDVRLVANEIVNVPANDTGIYVQRSLTGCVLIADNVLRDFPAATRKAIFVEAHPVVIITGNVIANLPKSDALAIGVRALGYGGGHGNIQWCFIEGNTILDLPPGTRSVEVAARDGRTIDHLVIKENSFCQAGGIGVYASDSGALPDVAVHGNSYVGITAGQEYLLDVDPPGTATVDRRDPMP